jgi:glucose 1-dehydrogenase
VLVQGDVSREADVVAMVVQTVSELGGLDVVINNAGIQISRHSHELASDDFDKVLAVNLRGAFLCAREAIRHFLAENKPGVIINVSSVHQLIPKPDYLGFGQQGRDAGELHADTGAGVRGARDPRQRHRPRRDRHADQPRVDRRSGQARAGREPHTDGARGTAWEMGAVACFLASDDAAYITGQTIFVDGGLTLFPSFREPWSSE